MTPRPSNEMNYFESRHRYQRHSRPQARHQHDSNNKESPQLYKFCNYCRKGGHSISRYLKRQTNHYRKTNFHSRKQNEQQSTKSATQKEFKDIFRNNRGLVNK